MQHSLLHRTFYATISLGLWLTLPFAALAQTVPGPADIGRVKPEERLPILDHTEDGQITVPTGIPAVEIPKGAEDIHFVLKDVRVEGATAFTPEQLQDIYTPYMDKKITLDVAYVMAGMITERYRNAGYFLSRAYVPAQEIQNGIVTIHVVEGYIGEVELPESAQNRIVQAYIDHLTEQKPLSAQKLESSLLHLNDLPGYSFRGTLSVLEGANDGATKLILTVTEKEGKGSVIFDNASSRFLGPNELSASYTQSLLPLQQTTISGLASLPTDKLRYAALNHAVAIAPQLAWDINGSLARAQPGFMLEPFEIESESSYLGTSLLYQWIRQRQQNLSLKLTLDARNTATDLLQVQFTRDRIRAARANVTYDTYDSWHGYSIASVTVSQGIDGLGSSEKGELNLSRAQAKPDFTKAELSLARLQGISSDWSLLLSAFAQTASGPLFSSEEFGYGGQGFGRAYDASEITGDHGVAASFELRYGGWDIMPFDDGRAVSINPYAFYDIGVVWNDDIAQVKRESGASTGFGVRFATPWHQSGNVALAWPLTRDVGTPIYGQSERDPRIILNISQDF